MSIGILGVSLVRFCVLAHAGENLGALLRAGDLVDHGVKDGFFLEIVRFEHRQQARLLRFRGKIRRGQFGRHRIQDASNFTVFPAHDFGWSAGVPGGSLEGRKENLLFPDDVLFQSGFEFLEAPRRLPAVRCFQLSILEKQFIQPVVVLGKMFVDGRMAHGCHRAVEVNQQKLYCKYIFCFAFDFNLVQNSPDMRLSTYSDYAIRVLMQAALHTPRRLTVDEVAGAFAISRHHLVKVVHDLGRSGYLQTQRGIGGGFTLAGPPENIRLGDIVRLGEETDRVIDCMDRPDQPCRMFPACRLRGVLDEAAAAFFAVLDGYSLADLLQHPSKMRAALRL